MSITKFESLPNELLITLLENYLNAVDVFTTFHNQFNSRFDALIDQCQRFRFDFTGIRKKHFHICMNLLPQYMDKIVCLTLSDEENTPEQMNLFLSMFPSLNVFKGLRAFRVNFDAQDVNKDRIDGAFRSLVNTNLRHLSIKITYTIDFSLYSSIRRTISQLSTLKCLDLAIDTWTTSLNVEPFIGRNLVHLTSIRHGCTWNELQHLCRNAPHLKYLHAHVRNKPSNSISFPLNNQVIHFDRLPLTRLQTISLHFIDRYTEVTWNQLVEFFHTMPNLHQLEVSCSHNRFFNAADWQRLFENSLSLVTDFILKIRAARLSQQSLEEIHSSLTRFQTLFWVAKKNFCIFMIIQRYYGERISYYQPIDPQRHRFDIDYNVEIESPTAHFWVVPKRSTAENPFLMNHITSLHLDGEAPLPLDAPFFDHVKCLKIDCLSAALLEWMTAHTQLSIITELILRKTKTNSDVIASLLSRTKNVSSLQINYKRFIDQSMRFAGENQNIKRLDVSLDGYLFDKEAIRILARFFPTLKHLKLDTIVLDMIPFVCSCLPDLHSLTLKTADPPDLVWAFTRPEQRCENHFRTTTKLVCKRVADWLTIWIDEMVFHEPYWQAILFAPQGDK